ncbi:MAG: hypothetical protein LBN34_09030 [Clostridiales Family XIII bacterium]|nr:hypothetical protein [Clostridiales Family XIII bacterium]
MAKGSSNRSMQKTRHIALLLCVLFIAASLISGAFIATHANHEHDRNGPNGSCTTCTQVMVVGNLLKTLGLAAATITICIALHYAIIYTLKPIVSDFCLSTLVSLKVQLNS